MASGRRSPYRRRGLVSESTSNTVDDQGERREETAHRPSNLELPQEQQRRERRNEPSPQRQPGSVSSSRGRSGKETSNDADQTEPRLPSYTEATETRPRASSAIPTAGSPPPSLLPSDRPRGLQPPHLLLPLPLPDASTASGASLPRPRSAQDHYDYLMTFSPDRDTQHQSYLRDPRLNDSFLHDPYSRAPSLFGPREPTYLSPPRHERATMIMTMTHVQDSHARGDARRLSATRSREDLDDEPSAAAAAAGKRGRGSRQGLLGALLGVAVQSGMSSYGHRRERAVSMQPPTSRRMVF